MVRGGGDKAADQVEAVRTAEQGQGGVVHDLPGQGVAVALRDVGEIGDDQIKSLLREGGEEITFDESDVRDCQ